MSHAECMELAERLKIPEYRVVQKWFSNQRNKLLAIFFFFQTKTPRYKMLDYEIFLFGKKSPPQLTGQKREVDVKTSTHHSGCQFSYQFYQQFSIQVAHEFVLSNQQKSL